MIAASQPGPFNAGRAARRVRRDQSPHPTTTACHPHPNSAVAEFPSVVGRIVEGISFVARWAGASARVNRLSCETRQQNKKRDRNPLHGSTAVLRLAASIRLETAQARRPRHAAPAQL